MPSIIESDVTIIKCTNPVCMGTYTIICYTFADAECTKISDAHIVPLSGNTPYSCPCCGTNLGKPEVTGKGTPGTA